MAQKQTAQMQFYLVINSLNLISHFYFFQLKNVKWEIRNAWDFFFHCVQKILKKQLILKNGRALLFVFVFI